MTDADQRPPCSALITGDGNSPQSQRGHLPQFVQLKATHNLSRSSIDDGCVDSRLTILGDDPMTDLVLENFAVFGPCA
jgi:hypothetical protein